MHAVVAKLVVHENFERVRVKADIIAPYPVAAAKLKLKYSISVHLTMISYVVSANAAPNVRDIDERASN